MNSIDRIQCYRYSTRRRAHTGDSLFSCRAQLTQISSALECRQQGQRNDNRGCSSLAYRQGYIVLITDIIGIRIELCRQCVWYLVLPCQRLNTDKHLTQLQLRKRWRNNISSDESIITAQLYHNISSLPSSIPMHIGCYGDTVLQALLASVAVRLPSFSQP